MSNALWKHKAENQLSQGYGAQSRWNSIEMYRPQHVYKVHFSNILEEPNMHKKTNPSLILYLLKLKNSEFYFLF